MGGGLHADVAHHRRHPSDSELAREANLWERARQILKSKKKKDKDVVEMVEAWNLADTEAWRFVRAYGARRRVERLQWEHEEKGFVGAEIKYPGSDRVWH